MRIRNLLAVAGVALVATACDLDLSNPNAPAEEEVLGEAEGIVSLAIGLQGDFAAAIEGFVQGPGLVTDELGTGTRSLIAYQSLLTGDNFDPDYGVVEEPFADAYEVVRAADALVANAPTVDLPRGVQTGIVALARTYKAMALGMIIQQYERVPLQISSTQGSPLAERQEVFDTIFSLLESARSDFAGLSEAERGAFRTRVLPAGFDLASTIDAMLARYKLFAARERDSQALYQEALEAAQRVPAGATSVVTYGATNTNPIYDLSVVAGYVFPLRSFVTEARPGDQRPAYWVRTDTAFAGNPDSVLVTLDQYNQPTGTFPLFLPDEPLLIRAEAQTRLGNLEAARELVNQVRTQTTNPPVAGLPALPALALDTVDELLFEIAYNRRYELFLQGLRWEDARTLQPYVSTSPVFPYFPIPTQECQTNPALSC